MDKEDKKINNPTKNRRDVRQTDILSMQAQYSVCENYLSMRHTQY